ncbi:MAG: ubiquinone/menaquinone biosynthesis methyltransferase [Chloroflexi bacterium]|nr:ubiquinone/menaquinone biosynthesis methyltransferase [Chloroflexota bacterium]
MTSSSPSNSRARAVQAMFGRIALRYDLFNTVATLGRDSLWRRRAALLAAPAPMGNALDAATGTSKLAQELARRARQVIAFDFSDRMIALARRRFQEKSGHGSASVRLMVADALAMPFQDSSFDCATIAFGLRNVTDPGGCLREFLRVLKPGGRLVVLEIFRPSRGLNRLVYEAFFKRAVPLMGWALTGDRTAYQYLPTSVDAFLSPAHLAALMESSGFLQVSYRSMHLDTISLHLGVKPG